MNDIQKQNLKDWIAALRSGDYKQTRLCLSDINGYYCSLGVACEVMHVPKIKCIYTYQYQISKDYFSTKSPGNDWLLEKFGITECGILMMMNDSHQKSFNEIADYLETRLNECQENSN